MEYVSLSVIAGGILFYRAYKEKIARKYESFKRLNRLVGTRHKNQIVIFIISCKMIIGSLVTSLGQYLTNPVKKIGKNIYEVSYIIEGKKYKMIVSPMKGPAPVLAISNDTMEDVTEQVISYLGPKCDWHGNKFTPDFFGHKSLTVQMADGSTKTFTVEEHVHIE